LAVAVVVEIQTLLAHTQVVLVVLVVISHLHL
jgi:hypothetical protein